MATGPLTAQEAYPWMYQAVNPYANTSNQSTTSQTTGSNPYQSTDLNSLVSSIASLINYTPIQYSMPSRDDLASSIAAYLRPGVDNAISQRQKQTLTNRAEIDVDAASRGMGRSTYVTDVKDRAMDSEAADISLMESQYAADLLSQVEALMMQHQQNQFTADQINVSNSMNAQSAALNAALGLYGSNLDYERSQQKKSGSSSRASAPSQSGGAVDWMSYFADASPEARYAILIDKASVPGVKNVDQALKEAGVYEDIYKKYNKPTMDMGRVLKGLI